MRTYDPAMSSEDNNLLALLEILNKEIEKRNDTIEVLSYNDDLINRETFTAIHDKLAGEILGFKKTYDAVYKKYYKINHSTFETPYGTVDYPKPMLTEEEKELIRKAAEFYNPYDYAF